jgi:hypothetical protein
MALEAFMYGDPAKVFEIVEAKTCTGCQFEAKLKILGVKVKYCQKQRRHSDDGGQRCKLYRERS